jgi:glycosyltransferase involved in cell wall biosynthesis
MRILLVSDFYPPVPGGLESHVRRLAEELIRLGQSVAVVSGTPDPDPLPGDAAVHYAPTVFSRIPGIYANRGLQFPPPFPDPIFREAVRKVAESWRPDVIHAHGWCAFSSYWPAAPPLVVTLHDHGLRCPKRTLLRAGGECDTGMGLRCVSCAGSQSAAKRTVLAGTMRRSVPALAAHASKFIAVSRSVSRRAVEGSVAASKITVIPNFFDTAHTEPGPGAGKPRVLFVGPDSPHKGRAVAVAAFNRLSPGTATLALAGSDTPVHGEGVENLGYLRGAALWDQYRLATIAVAPAVWPEPCPTVVLEAMAHGLPVVGSDIGGIPDLIENGVSGLLVPPNDPVSLAETMHSLLADDARRGKLAAAARERSLMFDTEAVVPRILEVYESALAGPESTNLIDDAREREYG